MRYAVDSFLLLLTMLLGLLPGLRCLCTPFTIVTTGMHSESLRPVTCVDGYVQDGRRLFWYNVQHQSRTGHIGSTSTERIMLLAVSTHVETLGFAHAVTVM